MALRPQNDSHRCSPEALLRYQVVCAVVAREHAGDLRADAIAEVAERTFVGHNGAVRRPASRTIYRWLLAFEQSGVAGLEPAARPHIETSRVVPQPLLAFVAEQKRTDPAASMPELLRRAAHLGLIASTSDVAHSSLHRACERAGIATSRRKTAKVRDSRRFEYPNRMMMLLCDGKHFRAGAGRLKRVALFFLDDCSRFGIHVIVGTAESVELFLLGFFEVVLRVGLPVACYFDKGPGFTGNGTVAVLARLGVILIHGEAGYPEGRGKIERFNRTVLDAVLRNDNGRADIDPSPAALQRRLAHWLEHSYNQTPHESLPVPHGPSGAWQTPWQRFSSDPRPLQMANSLAELRTMFVLEHSRDVSNDHVVSFEAVNYEVPRGLAGQRVRLFFHLLDRTLLLPDPAGTGRLLQLAPVDLAANARARRGKDHESALHRNDETQPVPPKSAADMAFARDLSPMVGPDGGFADPTATAPKRSRPPKKEQP